MNTIRWIGYNYDQLIEAPNGSWVPADNEKYLRNVIHDSETEPDWDGRRIITDRQGRKWRAIDGIDYSKYGFDDPKFLCYCNIKSIWGHYKTNNCVEWCQCGFLGTVHNWKRETCSKVPKHLI